MVVGEGSVFRRREEESVVGEGSGLGGRGVECRRWFLYRDCFYVVLYYLGRFCGSIFRNY